MSQEQMTLGSQPPIVYRPVQRLRVPIHIVRLCAKPAGRSVPWKTLDPWFPAVSSVILRLAVRRVRQVLCSGTIIRPVGCTVKCSVFHVSTITCIA